MMTVLFLAIVQTNAFAISKIETLKQAAERGKAADELNLALAYDFGQGAKPNILEAAKWYAKAAAQGLPMAQNALGSLYESGDGVPKDYKKAVDLYQKAADQGDASALANLGYMYDLGLGVEEDNNKAVELYKKAANQGNLQAMLNLGVMYMQGDGVKSDYIEGFKWLDLVRFYTTVSKDMKLKWRARDALGQVKVKMTKEQIKEGRTRVKEWSKNHQVYNLGVSRYAN